MCAITFSDYQSFIKKKDKLTELKTEPVIKSSKIELVVLLSFFLFNLCVCMNMSCGSSLSPSTVWVLGIKISSQAWRQAPLPTKPSCWDILSLFLQLKFYFCFFEIGSHFIAVAGLELTM